MTRKRQPKGCTSHSFADLWMGNLFIGGWYPFAESGRNNSPLPRALPALTHYYTRARGKRRFFALDEKPDILKHLNTVDQTAWEQFEAHLKRIRPLERAEFYRRLMEERNVRSVCALARQVGKDEAGIRQYLNLLKLPAPIQDYLKEHPDPATVRYFSEKRLKELLKLNPRAAWRRFQEMVAQARREAGIWSQAPEEASLESL